VKKALLITIILLVLAGCNTAQAPVAQAQQEIGYCDRDAVEVSLDEYSRVVDRWNDMDLLGGVTQRMNLPMVLSDMIKLKWEAQEIVHPECMDKTEEELMKHMATSLESYRLFLTENEDESLQKSQLADTYMQAYIREKNRILECAPDCE